MSAHGVTHTTTHTICAQRTDIILPVCVCVCVSVCVCVCVCVGGGGGGGVDIILPVGMVLESSSRWNRRAD